MRAKKNHKGLVKGKDYVSRGTYIGIDNNSYYQIEINDKVVLYPTYLFERTPGE